MALVDMPALGQHSEQPPVDPYDSLRRNLRAFRAAPVDPYDSLRRNLKF